VAETTVAETTVTEVMAELAALEDPRIALHVAVTQRSGSPRWCAARTLIGEAAHYDKQE